jgi:hypothetical protein
MAARQDADLLCAMAIGIAIAAAIPAAIKRLRTDTDGQEFQVWIGPAGT